MIYIYIFLLIVFAFIGIKLNNYFQTQMTALISDLILIKTNRSGMEIIQNFSTGIYEITTIENGKGYVSDYYDDSENKFYLSKETAHSNNGAAASSVIYLLLQLRITKKRTRRREIIIGINSILQFLILPFAIIALFATSIHFLILSFSSYVFVLLTNLILIGSHFSINRESLYKIPTEHDFHFEQNEINSSNRYIQLRQFHLMILFIFTPATILSHYIYFIFYARSQEKKENKWKI
jgi:Zn-dependent membrane protease YugP